MKKWNWFLFTVVVLTSCAAALGNVNIKSIGDAFTLGLGLGIPIGLLLAWTAKHD